MEVQQILSHFNPNEQVLIAANLLLLLFSRPMLKLVFRDHDEQPSFSGRLKYFRLANLLVLLFVIGNGFLRVVVDEDHWISRVLAVFLATYLAYLCFYITNYFVKRRYGREKDVDGSTHYVETYNARVLSMIIGVVIFVITFIANIRILGLDTWLEAGGAIGIIGVMLALTQGAWAPDIISGLVILNSRLVGEGDVIEYGQGPDKIIGVVFRTKVFYTEILHLVNNHRIMIQNARLRAVTIHNLSRFASARGLRESVSVNVSYGVEEQQIKALFHSVFRQAVEDSSIRIESQYEPEVRASAARDYSVEWSCFYYTKDAKHLIRTRQLLLALTLETAREQGVDLATPDLYQKFS